MQRFVKYCNPGVEALLVLPVYLERITVLAARKGEGAVVLNKDTVHRLVAAGLLIAGKLSHDRFFSNKHFAKVASEVRPPTHTKFDRCAACDGCLRRIEMPVSGVPTASSGGGAGNEIVFQPLTSTHHYDITTFPLFITLSF